MARPNPVTIEPCWRKTGLGLLGGCKVQLLHAVTLLLLLAQASVFGQAAKEYQIKSVFLFRLAQFSDWPANAFETERSPVVIGVLGQDPFGESLVLAVQGETSHNRPLEVRRFRSVEDIKECHVLFISRSEDYRLSEILDAISSRAILSVSDSQDAVMVRFVTENNKITLRIDPDRAKASGLVLNSRLLRMAEIVKKR